MAKFEYTLLTHSPERLNVIATKFGVDANSKFTMAEIGKAVKMAAGSKFVLPTAGDELEGFVDSLEAATMDGLSFGGAARPGIGFRVEAKVAGTTLVWGDLVVAGAQAAIGTKSLPVVQKGTPTTFVYKVINLYTGGGVAGSTVLLERVS